MTNATAPAPIDLEKLADSINERLNAHGQHGIAQEFGKYRGEVNARLTAANVFGGGSIIDNAILNPAATGTVGSAPETSTKARQATAKAGKKAAKSKASK